MTDTKIRFLDSLGDLHPEQLSPEYWMEIQFATCVVLLETALIDLDYPDTEQHEILKLVSAYFDLKPDECDAVVKVAWLIRHKRENLSRFLNLLCERFTQKDRMLLYSLVWKVIKADDSVDARELLAAGNIGQKLGLSSEDEIEARREVIEGRV